MSGSKLAYNVVSTGFSLAHIVLQTAADLCVEAEILTVSRLTGVPDEHGVMHRGEFSTAMKDNYRTFRKDHTADVQRQADKRLRSLLTKIDVAK